MSINLRLSSSPNGERNRFDNQLDFSSFGASPGASGSTNTSAVSAFNTAYAALSGRTRLYIPPGTYTFGSQFNIANTAPPPGSSLIIDAYGVTIAGPVGSANAVANTAGVVQGVDNFKETRIDTVSTGSDTVTLKTSSETSRFSADKWVVVTGVNTQGAGDPPNPGLFEYKKIQSVGSGTLTFTEPLVNSYKDTWPAYSGGGVGRGGPASIYPLQGAWDQEVEFRGATFASTNDLTYGKTRIMRWTDCTWETYGPCPSVNLLYRVLRSTTLGTAIEADKLVQRMEVIDSTIRAIDFQSSSINELYVTGTTATVRWRGVAGGTTYINGLNTPEFRFGVSSYGVVKGLTTVENCNSANATWSPGYFANFSDYTEEGGGVLSIATTTTPPAWAVPGSWCVLTDGADQFNGISFQVTDLTQSGGTVYIHTTLPYPVPSTSGGKSAPWEIRAHPGAHVTAINCTGSTLFTNQSALPANSPLFGWSLS